MGTTLATPATVSSDSRISSRLSPIAAMTVRSVPTMTWALSPSLSTFSAAFWTSCSVASRFMTMIMAFSSQAVFYEVSGSAQKQKKP